MGRCPVRHVGRRALEERPAAHAPASRAGRVMSRRYFGEGFLRQRVPVVLGWALGGFLFSLASDQLARAAAYVDEALADLGDEE